MQEANRPPPLSWLHQPALGGLDSAARRYRGYAQNDMVRLLRPASPLMLKLRTGDLLTLKNAEGGTPVLLFVFDERATGVFNKIGLESNPKRNCKASEPGMLPIAQWFQNKGGRLLNATADKANASLTAAMVFDDTTPVNESFILRAKNHVTLWMLIDPAKVYSSERVFFGGMGGTIEYELVRTGNPIESLPDPIGDIREEFTVHRGTAKAYELKAGEVVQIIDVEGRQCSDFMALNAHALDQGSERLIDSTVTRSMVRGAYPIPGLFDKFFDQDMRPLLKLKQDTVGRHDTFAYACTARGYEERGFFGHLNCSDNISNAYLPFGITPRAAWPAINFFFNSWIDHTDNLIRSDEAWSRPGDYVALEAMTDLVAVSTACPDDVDPINGWNPTDIHVRIYKKNTPIRHAVAYRSEPDSEPILTDYSAFHERTSALTRHFVVARDLWLPQSFESTRSIEEYRACRESVTVQDMSSLRKFDVLGPDAEALLQLALTRDITRLSVNRGVYALMCDDTGTVIDDGTLFRLGPDTFRWCCGADESGKQLKQLATDANLNVWIKSLYSALPNLAVQGPNSRELIRRISFTQPHATAVEQLRWFGSTIARLHDREGVPFHLTRTGYTGELGFEIFCHPDAALALWDALFEVGADLGIKPMGLEALEVLRIEAGFMAAGAEFGPGVDAYESGLGFAVDLNKREFVGRSALERNQQQPRRMLKGLRLVGHEAPSHGDPIMLGRRQVGVVTSATISPALDCAIAIARLAIEHADQGQTLEIGKLDNQAKRLRATVCDIPFVDPSRSKARS